MVMESDSVLVVNGSLALSPRGSALLLSSLSGVDEFLVMTHQKPDNNQNTWDAEAPRKQILHVFFPLFVSREMLKPSLARKKPFLEWRDPVTACKRNGK
jgi:hypothetical protein